ncbi:hypothetical protein BH23CHL10_BH23CHL10_12930 [soil metagenome]
MNAVQTANVQGATVPAARVELSPPAINAVRLPMVGVLRVLLLSEAVATLALAIFLSLLAAAMRGFLGGDIGRAAEEMIRFAAAASFGVAIFAAIASRGARRHRPWSWTLAALLQVVVAIGTGVAVMSASWHPVFLLGFALPTAVMLVLSAPSVRQALGQE